MSHAFPGETFGGPSHVEADELKRVGSCPHLIEPLGQEVGVIRLAVQTADLVMSRNAQRGISCQIPQQHVFVECSLAFSYVCA